MVSEKRSPFEDFHEWLKETNKEIRKIQLNLISWGHPSLEVQQWAKMSLEELESGYKLYPEILHPPEIEKELAPIPEGFTPEEFRKALASKCCPGHDTPGEPLRISSM